MAKQSTVYMTSPSRLRAWAAGSVLLLFLAFPLGAWAQLPPTATSLAINDSTCAADRVGSTFNCTAGEFTGLVQFQLPPNSPISCDAGAPYIGSVIADLNGTNTDRYDGGIYFGQAGNFPGALNTGGTCSVAAFPNTSIGTGFRNIDLQNDCGDFRGGGVERWQVANVKVNCVASDTGQLLVPYLLVYSQNSPGVCSATSNLLVPGSPAKCNSGTIPLPGVAVYGWVDITKQTNPDGSTQPFNFTVAGVDASPLTFSLTDGQTQRVRIRLLGQTPAVLTISESAAAGWVTTASITCTSPSGTTNPAYVTRDGANRRITANLTNTNPTASCTITNSKLTRVRTVKALSPSNDAGTFNLTTTGASPAGSTTASAVGHGGATPWLTVNPATSVTFSEAAAGTTLQGAYDSSYSCRNNDTNAVVTSGTGTTVTVASVPSYADTTCTFTNTRRAADLSVVKTASPASRTAIVVGGAVRYTVVVSNAGPSSATGAVVTDIPNTALNCPAANAVTCSSTATACSTGPYTVSQLTGSGITLGTLTANSTATLTFDCTVQ